MISKKYVIILVPCAALCLALADDVSQWLSAFDALRSFPTFQVLKDLNGQTMPSLPTPLSGEVAVLLPMLRFDQPAFDTPPDSTPEIRDLATAVKKHADVLRDSCSLTKEYLALRTGAALPTAAPFSKDHPYWNVYDERYRVVAKEGEILTLEREQHAQFDQIRTMLEEYRRMNGASQDFYRLGRAEVDGYSLRHLKPLDLDNVLAQAFDPQRSEAEIQQIKAQAEQRINEIQIYRQTYGEVGSYVDWSRLELEKWTTGLNVITTFDRIRSLPIREQIGQFADLIGSNRNLAIQGVRALCEGYLPRDLPLDVKVRLPHSDLELDSDLIVSKSAVVVVWEDKRMERLTEIDANEFSLPRAKIRRLIVDGWGTRRPLLKPTASSLAAWTFNENRKSLPWTPAGLNQIKTACEPYREQMQDVWSRIVELTELADHYPMLFGAKQ